MAKAHKTSPLKTPARSSEDREAGSDEGLMAPPRVAIRLEFARRLKKALYDRRMSQQDLADETEMGKDSISVYCRGRSLPSDDNLEKIARVLSARGPKIKTNDLLPFNTPENTRLELMPALEIRQANKVGDVFIRVNQTITMEQAAKIIDVLKNR